jgi:hypothetical protein
MNAVMDDQALIKAFLKKQKEIQDQFLIDFAKTKPTIDTSRLERILNDNNATLERFSTLTTKVEIDTSSIERDAQKALNRVITNYDFNGLSNKLAIQTAAIEKNNAFLEKSGIKKLKLWLYVLTFIVGLFFGTLTNWYFEIPAKLTDNYQKDKLLESYRNIILNSDTFVTYINSDCKLKKGYAKFVNMQIQCNQTWKTPKQQLDEVKSKE